MRLFELEQGYKMVKGVPEYQPRGDKVSPFYQKQLGPGWDQASRDKDIDDIMGPGTAQKRREIRADPRSQYKSTMSTGFSGGGSTELRRQDDGSVKKTVLPSINAKVTTTTSKQPYQQPVTKNTFRGNL